MLIQPINTNIYKNNLVNFGSSKKTSVKAVNDGSLDLEQTSLHINQALNALDKKLEVIIHNASAPTLEGRDVGVGSLYSNSSLKLLIPFLKTYGFSGIQAEPEGMRMTNNPSPYNTNSFIYNPLMADLENLTKPEYGAIVDYDVYKSAVQQNTAQKNMGDYTHARDVFGIAFDNAWTNFKCKSEDIDSITNEKEKKAIIKLNKDLQKYKAQNGDMLESHAIYSVLTDVYGNDYYKCWPKEMDDLYYPRNDKLIKKIKQHHKDELDKFMFVDMLAKNARDRGVKEYAKAGITIAGDNPVAFSHAEVWAHKGAFLEGYKLGSPPEKEIPNGQSWDFPVYNPAKLFNRDGSLGEAGQLLYDKCLKLAKDNQGGIRIDHIFGLIDPFVYKQSPAEPGAGRLFSSKNNPDLAQFYIDENRPDRLEKLNAIIEKIVIPACKEGGLDTDDIICENLGSYPQYIKDAFSRLNLGGMVITQYKPGIKAKPSDTIMIGSHDTRPLVSYVNKLYDYSQNLRANNYQNKTQPDMNEILWPLLEQSVPRYYSHDQIQQVFDKYRYDWADEKTCKEGFAQQKLTELFTSPAKRVQIFWPDLFKMTERYNRPGTTTDNWMLRMSVDTLNNYDPVPIIQAIETALKSKDENFVRENRHIIDALDKDIKALKNPGARLNFVV